MSLCLQLFSATIVDNVFDYPVLFKNVEKILLIDTLMYNRQKLSGKCPPRKKLLRKFPRGKNPPSLTLFPFNFCNFLSCFLFIFLMMREGRG